MKVRHKQLSLLIFAAIITAFSIWYLGSTSVIGAMAVYAQVNDDNTYQPYQYEPVTAPNPWRQGDNDDW